MAVMLDPWGGSVPLPEGITLRTPGLVGEVDVTAVPAAAQRDAGAPAAAWLNEALEEHDGRSRFVLQVRDTATAPVEEAMAVRTKYGEPAIVATVPAPPPDHVQVALVTDESGVTTWHVPEAPSAPVAVRDPGVQTFVLRGTVPPAQGNVEQRGFGGWLAKKIVRFVVVPLAKRAGAEVGELLVRRWERDNRPHRLRSFTPRDFTSRGEELAPSVFSTWSGKRALLFVHGTSDSARTSFGRLDRGLVEDLHRQYDGRVFAFDHPTLATAPRDNVAWFLAQLPPEVDLQLDVVCSSRGGLVSRLLSEQLDHPDLRAALGSRRLSVDRLVFSATPNAGTRLVDTEHLTTYVDAFTNLLTLVPDNPVTDAAAAIISLVADLATGVADQLVGLQSMRPNGDLLRELNQQPRSTKRYYALTSDFEPQHAGFRKWATDVLVDQVFGEPNDLVVPTAGTYRDVGGGPFPIAPERRHEFTRSEGISHGGFFANNTVHQRLRTWLEV